MYQAIKLGVIYQDRYQGIWTRVQVAILLTAKSLHPAARMDDERDRAVDAEAELSTAERPELRGSWRELIVKCTIR